MKSTSKALTIFGITLALAYLLSLLSRNLFM
ncbi:TPA: 1,4-dihydroxy-2-naphthoate polyprenyltransferase, partial [Listeria monocytogenes]|nr:1,4-dihydroxy-2-naphthoate polyprenyltransferase [Listeria monocytogenes]